MRARQCCCWAWWRWRRGSRRGGQCAWIRWWRCGTSETNNESWDAKACLRQVTYELDTAIGDAEEVVRGAVGRDSRAPGREGRGTGGGRDAKERCRGGGAKRVRKFDAGGRGRAGRLEVDVRGKFSDGCAARAADVVAQPGVYAGGIADDCDRYRREYRGVQRGEQRAVEAPELSQRRRVSVPAPDGAGRARACRL